MMKPALLLTTALLAGTAQADILGLTAEVGSYSPSADDSYISDSGSSKKSADLDGKSGTYFGIAFEHPLPLIPNVRFQTLDLKANGSSDGKSAKLDLSHQDYTLYYEFLDGLLWIDLDAGLTVRKFDGSVSLDGDKSNLSDFYPLGYVAGYVTVPGTRLSFGGEVKAGGFDGSSITDTTLKVKYQSPFLVGLEGGYRKIDLDLDDIDGKDIKSDFSGVFVGAFIDF
ncbi:MAG: TIGR04219 family outer membrane beta-barrel protein [Marinomonas sp.]|jgi:outer membrane protein|uniref:TIGR04219 family outer membrane beta-barrel protein n=1 Tax=unclassified Marinomonas TaxID=196814 RepID=UPI0037C70F91